MDCVLTDGRSTAAAAICIDCGAAVCRTHARITPRHLTTTVPICRPVPVEPAARTVRCGTCHAATAAPCTWPPPVDPARPRAPTSNDDSQKGQA